MSSAGTAGKWQGRESNQVSDSSGPQSFSGRSLRSALKERTPGAGLGPRRGNPTSLPVYGKPESAERFLGLWRPLVASVQRRGPHGAWLQNLTEPSARGSLVP